MLRAPTFPTPSQDRGGNQGPGGCPIPQPHFQAVPTSGSPCPTLEGARGTQSFDDASNSVGPPSKCYLFTSQIIRNSGLRMQERGGGGAGFITPIRWQRGREPGPSRECHPENGGHVSLRGARTRKAKDEEGLNNGSYNKNT